MASTNKTVNYELSQFEGTDKPSWEADYNADMLAIDTNLKAVSDVADGASGSLSTLADRVTTAEGNISTNANDIDALEARADALESGETIADGRLDALEAEQLIQNTAIEGNTQLGYNLARPYDSASTYAVGAYVLFQNTLYKCITAVSTGEAFDPNKWLAIKATDEIAAGGYTLPTASASTLGGVKIGSGLSIDPVTGILSAAGGSNTEISYFDNSNNPFTIGTCQVSSRVINTTTTNTTTSTNTTITLQEGVYIKNGNIRILKGSLQLAFDPVTLNSGSYSIDYFLQLTSTNFDLPYIPISLNGRVCDGDHNIMYVANNAMRLTLQKNDVVAYPINTTTISTTTIAFCFIYTVS